MSSKLIARLQSFWGLQLCGWLVYTLATAASILPFPHDKGYVGYRLAFLLTCFLCSFALYPLCHGLWRRHTGLYVALAWTAAAAYLLGLVCSAAGVWAEIHFGQQKMPFEWRSAFAGATSGWFLLFGWSSCYFGIKHFHELEKQKRDLFASQALLREAQLQALRYQLQPHFLYNTLNAISTLVLQGKSKRATQMIARLGDLLRETLAAPDTHLVSLAEELITTRLYIAIEQMRFEARLVFAEEISDDVLAARVPRFLLQPLVENSVRHGIAKLTNGGRLLLKASKESDTLVLDVFNDCPPLSAVANGSNGSDGLGLANTRARLEHLYGDGQSIVTFPNVRNGEFAVTVRVPFTTQRESSSPVGDLVS